MFTHTNLKRLYITIILPHVLCYGAWGLKDVRISVPKYFRRGSDVTLNCEYDLESKALYVVKWYYQENEFYRFLPTEIPPQKAFPIPGINVTVDVSLSNDHNVILRKVPMESSGRYKCLVSVEFPFQTLSAQSYALVIIVEEESPSVHLDRQSSHYSTGDELSAECRSVPSYPGANITWFINDKEANPGFTVGSSTKQNVDDPPTVMSLSRLSFQIAPNMTFVDVKCMASVYDEYVRNSSTITIKPIMKRISGPNNLQRSGSTGFPTLFNSAYLWCLLMMMIVEMELYMNDVIMDSRMEVLGL